MRYLLSYESMLDYILQTNTVMNPDLDPKGPLLCPLDHKLQDNEKKSWLNVLPKGMYSVAENGAAADLKLPFGESKDIP